MSTTSYNVIYVGKAGMIPTPPKPPVIPKKWKPILRLAYAYTTNSINSKLIDMIDVENTVAQHTYLIDELSEQLAGLDLLNNEEFVEKLNELGDKIDMLDPDLLLSLSYTYTAVEIRKTQYYSYKYADSLYEQSINKSYAKIDNVSNTFSNNLNNAINNINNTLTNFVDKDYIDNNFAKTENIPTKVSQLENDSKYITGAALTGYATSESVEQRINDIIGTAPSALDTLEEIAYALGNDENLAGTLTNRITELDEQKADRTEVQEMFDRETAFKNDIPIYDDSKIQELIDNGELPNKYINIRSTDTITQEGSSGRYLDIIFSTLRALQNEVDRLKRTFDKGIISMTNEQTHMSDVVRDYIDVDENEPLWAIDPDSLTEVTGAEFYIDNAHSLTPTNNVLVMDGKLRINPIAKWNDNYVNITSGEENNFMHDNTDAKQYVYITTSTTNVIITLTNYNNDNDVINIDLRTFNLPNIDTDKYNILVCVSRAVKYNTSWKGNDFIFVSVNEYYSGNTIAEGYYLPSTNKLTEYQVYLNTSANDSSNYRYFISQVEFNNLDLYRMTFYSKFQDFSNDVQPTVPNDDDTYSVAHITIRSVKNIEQLRKIKNQLLENELIYNDSNNCIYIIKNNEIKLISGGSTPEPPEDVTGMERSEIIAWLESNGIIGLTQTDDELFDKLSFNSVGDITFINELGKKYKFTVDSNGELKSTIVNENSLADRLKAKNIVIDENITHTDFTNIRGFVGTLGEYESGKRSSATDDRVEADLALYSDRVKIGNIYAPWRGSTVYGCTHGYIELENSSDKDFELDDCWIHFARRNDDNTVDEHSLQLHGVIPAGGTYLIRCKKYSDISQSNTFIDVNSFDIEWVTPEGELFDIYLGNKQNTFLLTYKCPGQDWVPTKIIDNESVPNTFNFNTTMIADAGANSINAGYKVYHPCYIDSVSVIAHITANDSNNAPTTGFTWCGWPKGGLSGKSWAASKGIYKNANKLDALYKTTFELDPAKQAYQGLCWNCTKGSGSDSSRVRTNTATDYQTVFLQKEYIEFPKSDEIYPVTMYTPMASYLHKNVCTDKTKLDMEKPNCVSVAFGINMYTTRCFNWVSAGEFNEYIWIRKQGTETWSKPFESYKERSASDTTYDTYREKLANSTLTLPYRKEFTNITNNAAYARIRKTFPGSGVKYTAHKCILEIAAAVTEKVVYEYVVGRADKNNKPDVNHSSDIQTFTMYPSSYVPRLFQTTDQQGFHWIEYQTWAACAKKINEMINDQCNSENIIPVVLNTGDATQNGTRYNEWLDYYIGGRCLFNHLEQMSIVGNNDLCGTNPEILGTGDDTGKSNGFYHHVFYCYEVDEKLNDGTYPTNENAEEKLTNKEYKYLPLIKGSDNIIRFIPSLYFYGTEKYTFVMMNSELTYINCGDWFKKKKMNGTTNQTVNLYTGWTILGKSDEPNPVYDDSFTTIYTMLYNIINDHKINKGSYETNANKKIQNLIIACHEMPFTVITAANLTKGKESEDRSINNKKSLVGSHMNKMILLDKKSNYWFSRLLEYFNVKFVYGGHKHTYAITNEVRENYLYIVDGVTKSSLNDGKMTMKSTLENDTASFALTLYEQPIEQEGQEYIQMLFDANSSTTTVSIDGSKFPIMNINDDVDNNYGGNKKNGIIIQQTKIYPYYGVTLDTNEELGGVIYMMCQATGFKLKSNKELPGPSQRFSFIIPQTTPNDPPATDSPSNHQLEPMLTEIHPNEHNAYLMRFLNIHKGDPYSTTAPSVLSQTDYGKDPIVVEYLHRSNRSTIDMYGAWTTDKTQLLSW